MKLFLNDCNEVDIFGLNSSTTVADFFGAIDAFAAEHPLPCGGCGTNCCKKRFFIEMDNISALRLAQGNMERFIADHLKIVSPPGGSIQILLSRATECCRYLTPSARCSVYENRPATCRTYTCRPRSKAYDIVDAVVVSALQHALIAAYFETLIQSASPELAEPLKAPLEWLKSSPAYGKEGYQDIRIKGCIAFDMEGLEDSDPDLGAYRRLMAMGER